MQIRKEIPVGKQNLVLETGKIAKQAGGAVMASYGDSVVLATACIDRREKTNLGFIPLIVDYRQRTSAAGKIPGGFFKREGRPSTVETITSRLIDRSVRPQLPKGINREVQIIGTAFSADPLYNVDVVAMNGAFAALAISSIPHEHILGAVRIGRVDGEFIINPNNDQLEESEMDILVTGGTTSLVMVEGLANQAPENVIAEGLERAHEEIITIVRAIRGIQEHTGREKEVFPEPEPDLALTHTVRELAGDRIYKALTTTEGKHERYAAFDAVRDDVIAKLEEQLAEEENKDEMLREANHVLHDMEREVVRGRVVKENIRVDGRELEEVRPISVEVPVMPRTHGSVLFTRGETQALVTVTLGTTADEQKIEDLHSEYWSHFILHYNFPPYSVGEVRFLRGPGRREIGHGVLAERALTAVLPDKDDFPYTIRVVSDITESNGSSSMATVCGGSLAMMDAGVPLKAAVAGVAMGLIKEGDDYHILTDILGDEDHVGDMDFKVAGSRNGVTAIQMDIKLDGLPTEVLTRALDQARRGRLHILDKMDAALDSHRPELSPYAPRIQTIDIPKEKIRDLIGPGGKVIRGIIDETGVSIDVDDDGHVVVASPDLEAIEAAMARINAIIEDPEVGEVYDGKVTRLMNFGAFVEILPGKEGLVHISEMAWGHTDKVEDVCKVGDPMKVKLVEIDSQGRLNLSRKALLDKPEGYDESKEKSRGDNRRSGGGGGGGRRRRR